MVITTETLVEVIEKCLLLVALIWRVCVLVKGLLIEGRKLLRGGIDDRNRKNN